MNKEREFKEPTEVVTAGYAETNCNSYSVFNLSPTSTMFVDGVPVPPGFFCYSPGNEDELNTQRIIIQFDPNDDTCRALIKRKKYS